MPEHWEPCTDVQAMETLRAGGKAQAFFCGGTVGKKIGLRPNSDAFFWGEFDGPIPHVPGRKFQRWVENKARTPMDDWPLRARVPGAVGTHCSTEVVTVCGVNLLKHTYWRQDDMAPVECPACRQVVGLDPPEPREAFEDTDPAPPDVPEGCERWDRLADGRFRSPRRDAPPRSSHDTAFSPPSAHYFEFLCPDPDGRWVFSPTPTIIWNDGLMWPYVSPGEDYQVLEARSAIVRKG